MNHAHSRALTLAIALLGGALLSACMSPPPASMPIVATVNEKGFSVVRSLPDVLPDKSVPVPHSQFVLIPNESAAGLLMPIPFVAEAIGAAMDRSAAEAFEARYASIAPYKISLEALRGSPLFRESGGGLTLQPFVFMTECVDDRYRLALVFQMKGADWTGRYMAHLPTTYSADAVKNPSPQDLATLGSELRSAAQTLRGLIERGARGELQPSGVRADVGSLHLVGGRAAGLMSPTVLVAKNADLIEENADQIIVRMPGKLSDAGTLGGLFYGVHVLRKDQLHTYKKL